MATELRQALAKLSAREDRPCSVCQPGRLLREQIDRGQTKQEIRNQNGRAGIIFRQSLT